MEGKVNKSRAVFAPEDYPVIRKALEIYLHTEKSAHESRILSRLLHRLHRVEYEHEKNKNNQNTDYELFNTNMHKR